MFPRRQTPIIPEWVFQKGLKISRLIMETLETMDHNEQKRKETFFDLMLKSTNIQK